MLALNRADALVYVGLDLEIGWLPPLVQQARNARIQRGQPGNIDASTAIRPEDVPNVPSDQLRAHGRHPPAGQPALLDPAQERARDRARCSPSGSRQLDARRRRRLQGGSSARFEAQLAGKEKAVGRARRRRCAGRKVVTYHKSWSYVARGSGWRRSATSSPSPASRPRRITPRSSSS